MKIVNPILYILLAIFLVACQTDDGVFNNVGYLRLNIGANSSSNTKAISADYKPKQIAVQIVNSKGQVIKETDDSETWKEPIALETGTYTVKASSNGFDGQESGFDIPYYAGSKQITIQANEVLQETITCTLANVKVTVNFDEDFLKKFEGRSINVQVGDLTNTNKFTSLNFGTSEKRSAYFPVGNLYATITINNPENQSEPYSLTQEFNEVKAKDHYILNYKVEESGSSNITVTVDPTTHEYSYTFTVSPEASNKADMTTGAWGNLAYLKAENVATASGVSTEDITFQYRIKAIEQTKADEAEWIDIETTVEGNTYTAILTGLAPSTSYEYRLASAEGETIGNISEFTTSEVETQEALPNGNFDDWYERANNNLMKTKTWYACSESYYNEHNGSFWDSSNPGTTTDAGMLANINPTQGDSKVVRTPGGKSAKLESAYKVKFAAASLYVGKFNSLDGTKGAKIDMGQPFTSRPIALKGYFQYAPANIKSNGVGSSGVLKEGDTDICSIFIILSKGTYQVNNTDTNTLLNEEKVKNTDQFIAYGELPASECVSTNGQWKEFNIPLKYKEQFFGEKPTHLIIVCSSSKYGDYFTGGEGSTLYLDDFELIYDGEPTMWE